MKLRNVALAAMASTILVTMVTSLDLKLDISTPQASASALEAGQFTSAYKDVAKQSPGYEAINQLKELGYLQTGDGLFKPDQTITVQHFAYLMGNTGIAFNGAYASVGSSTSADIYAPYVDGAIKANLLPASAAKDVTRNVTQQDLGAALINGFNLQSSGSDIGTPSQGEVKGVATFASAKYVVKSPFNDIAKTNPYYEIIHQMRDQKIISGYENGMFKPNDNINVNTVLL